MTLGFSREISLMLDQQNRWPNLIYTFRLIHVGDSCKQICRQILAVAINLDQIVGLFLFKNELLKVNQRLLALRRHLKGMQGKEKSTEIASVLLIVRYH